MINFYDFIEGYKANISFLFITNKFIMIMWDYYLSNKMAKSIILTLQHFFIKINASQKVIPTVFEYNNKIVTQKLRVTEYLE